MKTLIRGLWTVVGVGTILNLNLLIYSLSIPSTPVEELYEILDQQESYILELESQLPPELGPETAFAEPWSDSWCQQQFGGDGYGN